MTWPQRLIQILNLRCREASALVSQELDEPLGLAERLAVRGHLLVCGPCRRLRRQLVFLREAMNRQAGESQDSLTDDQKLSPAARSRIERAIERVSAGAPNEDLEQ
jgi:hypothetical protein